ncbi:MAG: septum site-determining protein MinC [Cyanobacteria bacterium P01_D01_bin.2]
MKGDPEVFSENFLDMDNGADSNITAPKVTDAQQTPDSSSPEKRADSGKQSHGNHTQDERSARLASTEAAPYVFEAEDTGDAVPLVDVSSLELEIEKQESDTKQQVQFKSERGRLLLLLPAAPENSLTPMVWEELCQQLALRLNSGNRFIQPNTIVHLIARDRLLDSRQLQEIDELLQTAQLRMKRIYTQRRQTAVAAVTAGYSVEQQTQLEPLNDSQNQGKAMDAPLYVQVTVRSGTEICHPGSIVVLGDVNPGGALIAAGDIFVWGRLRGLAHAGSQGNTACRIMALHMQPTQLRIAGHVARAPEKPPTQYQPEVAYVNKDSIRIAIASEFAQIHLNTP